MNIMTKTAVLVLNRNWQAINVRTPQIGRIGRKRDRFRPMASYVSALSSIVADGHQVLPTFVLPSRHLLRQIE